MVEIVELYVVSFPLCLQDQHLFFSASIRGENFYWAIYLNRFSEVWSQTTTLKIFIMPTSNLCNLICWLGNFMVTLINKKDFMALNTKCIQRVMKIAMVKYDITLIRCILKQFKWPLMSLKTSCFQDRYVVRDVLNERRQQERQLLLQSWPPSRQGKYLWQNEQL